MNLDDFDEFIKSVPNPHGHPRSAFVESKVKEYLAQKLREFGERLKKPDVATFPKPLTQWGEGCLDGWNNRNAELNADIDRELAELPNVKQSSGYMTPADMPSITHVQKDDVFEGNGVTDNPEFVAYGSGERKDHAGGN